MDVEATKKTNSSSRNRDPTQKKLSKEQAPTVERLSEHSHSSSSELNSEVSIESQLSEDFEYGCEKCQNTFQCNELNEIMEQTGTSNRNTCKIVKVCIRDILLRFSNPFP